MVTIVGVGDVMLGRGVAREGPYDHAALLPPRVEKALTADLVSGNLECVISAVGTPNPHSHHHFRGDPARSQTLLQRFDVLSLANNHTLDFGPVALLDTVDLLRGLGVETVGVGRTRAEAYAPVIRTHYGHDVAVFGATTVATAPRSRPDVVVAQADSFLRAALTDAADQGATVVLHLHAGGGDSDHPAPTVRELHESLHGSGAHIIFGHHPHVVQGWEASDRHVSFYSLGDFIFDKLEYGRRRSLIARVTVSNGTLTVDPVPVVRRSNLEVTIPDGREFDEFVEHLNALNAALAHGYSDERYWEWYGNPVTRLLQSVLTDFRVSGLAGVVAKLQRVDGHRLRFLFATAVRRPRARADK